MSTPEELARQAAAVAEVRAARIQRDSAVAHGNRRLREKIIKALSRQRIHQIMNEPR